MPPIYVSTTPGRYLQPANKLIHYSTEQSSSLLCLGSFTSLLGSRRPPPPTASLFPRDFSGNFARDSVKPLSRSVAETMIRRDLLAATTAESAAPSRFRTDTIDRAVVAIAHQTHGVKHGVICPFHRCVFTLSPGCTRASHLQLFIEPRCQMSVASHLLKPSLFLSAPGFSCPPSCLRRSNNSFIHPQRARARKGWDSRGILKCMSSFPRALLPFPFNLSSMLSSGTFVRVI